MMAELLNSNSQAKQWSDDEQFGCPAREDAIRLLAWIGFRPGDGTVDRLVSDLMHEQQQAHWTTTQGDAWALLALTEYGRQVENKLQPADGRVIYAGQTLPFHLDEHANACVLDFSITNLAGATLILTNDTTNCLYTMITISARPRELPQPRQDRGFSLQRTYQRLDDDNQARPATDLHVGDRVVVTLRLDVRKPASYVVIDDALPSILEAVNAEFNTQQARSAGALADNESWWPSDFREIRQDRCLWFADEVPPGVYAQCYVARVRAAGSVTAPPAKAEEMYHPERCGLTESLTLTSQPLP